jgi:Domain of unknown function (DUF5666)
MKKSNNSIFITSVMAIAIFASLAGSTYAATSDNSASGQFGYGSGHGNRQGQPGVSGTVSAISGSTITLLGRDGKTTYTIDASNSKVSKVSSPATDGAKPVMNDGGITDIQIGDTLRVQGTVNGTSVAATQIMDGKFQGQPGVSGTVSAISGSTITLLGRDGKTTYSVDASSAKISKTSSASTGTKPTTTTVAISDILVGDSIGVQGTVSGTSVAATTIMDGKFSGNRMGNGKFQGGSNGQATNVTGATASASCLKTEKATNASNVKSAKDTYTTAQKDAKTAYGAAVTAANDTYVAAQKDAKTAYGAAVTAAKAGDKSAYGAAVKAAKATYNAALKDAKTAYGAAVKAAKATYNAALKDAKTAYGAALATEKTRDTSAKTACKQ